MDKKLAGLVGAVAGLATIGAAHASPLPQARSYAELLGSLPNSSELLKADDLARADEATSPETNVQLAQYHHHHHHHHHQRVIIRRGHHHHHHVIVIKRRRSYHHHHHHHHHHHYD